MAVGMSVYGLSNCLNTHYNFRLSSQNDGISLHPRVYTWRGNGLRKKNKQRLLSAGARCSNTPPGQSDSKAVLDAFFLGKAFAEAVNERIGTTVGEILSEIGKWQAETQKQTLDFQEEVLDRARIARDKAAREALGKEQVKEPPTSSYTSSTSVSTESSPASDSAGSPIEPGPSIGNSGSLPTEFNEN